MPRRSLTIGIGVLAVCGAVFALQFASAVLIPLVVSLLLFYARDGFVATGDAFLEAGIAHRVMTRTLR